MTESEGLGGAISGKTTQAHSCSFRIVDYLYDKGDSHKEGVVPWNALAALGSKA